MHLAEATWTDADAADVDVAVVPVGSTEQHGPHAPLGTDLLSAAAVAEAGVDAYESETGGTAALTPPIPVGIAAEHRQFTGTLWVAPDTFRAYVRDTVASLASHGWTAVVLVNGHGGNVAALREVCADLYREEVARAVPFTWFDGVDLAEVAPDLAMGHGGPVETSLIQHLHPDLVATDRLAAGAEGAAETWGEWTGGTNLAQDTAEFSENGVVGDPTAASPAVGEALLGAAVAGLTDLMAAVRDREVTPPDHR